MKSLQAQKIAYLEVRPLTTMGQRSYLRSCQHLRERSRPCAGFFVPEFSLLHHFDSSADINSEQINNRSRQVGGSGQDEVPQVFSSRNANHLDLSLETVSQWQ